MLPNSPFPGALFYAEDPPNPQSVSIVLSMQGSGCEICGDSLSMGITKSLPICAPHVIAWDVNQGTFGPEVDWCAGPNGCEGALAGEIDFAAYDETSRAAGSYTFEFGGGQTISGMFDAIACSVPGGVTTCTP